MPVLLCGCNLTWTQMGSAVGYLMAFIGVCMVVSVLFKYVPQEVREWRKRRREAREARIRMWERAYAKEAQRKSEASPFRRSE